MAAVELQRMNTAAGGPVADDPAQQQERYFVREYGLTDDVLSMVYGADDHQRRLPGQQTQFEILKEERSNSTSNMVERTIDRICSSGTPPSTLSIFFMYLTEAVLAKLILDLRLPKQEVYAMLALCYYSSMGMGVNKDLLGELELQVLNFDFNTDMQPFHQPIHFVYNLRTGRSVYLLCDVKVPDLTAVTYAGQPRLHPFSLHLALLQQQIKARVDPMAQGLADMLKIERRLLDDPFPELISLDVLRKDIQNLHKITRLIILGENRASRNLSNVSHLVFDLNRLKMQTEGHQEHMLLDLNLHERMNDGFLSLHESCTTNLRRLKNRREQIANHIQL
ncbi:MAG: hypothetical protein Q9187_007994, partial [Circinaria calcarea]